MLIDVLANLVHVLPVFILVWGGPFAAIYILMGLFSSEEELQEKRYKVLKYAVFWTLVFFVLLAILLLFATPERKPVVAAYALAYGIHLSIFGIVFCKIREERDHSG